MIRNQMLHLTTVHLTTVRLRIQGRSQLVRVPEAVRLAVEYQPVAGGRRESVRRLEADGLEADGLVAGLTVVA
jgi:hypothetical protein